MSSIVGIDIGQSTVKITCLSNDDSKIVLNAIGESKILKTENKEIDRDKFLVEVGKEIKNLLNDLNKTLSTIKYLFKFEEKLTIINNSEQDIKSIIEINDFEFNVSYVDKENFVKIYDQLPG